MESRNEAINCVMEMLKEDIVDQFHINEVDAALEGKTVFSVTNSIGEKITLQNMFQENSETLIYDVVSCAMLMTPPTKVKKQVCNHPQILKGLEEEQFTCITCGIVADEEYVRDRK